jgi:hypothetical protein
MRLQLNLRIRITRCERAHPGEAKLARAIASVGGHFLALDDRECRIDVAHVIAVGDAVKVEINGIELRPELQAAVFIPDEGRLHLAFLIDIAHIAGEGGHVVRRVGQFQHGFADDFGGRLLAEADGLVAIGRHHGKLKVGAVPVFGLTWAKSSGESGKHRSGS